ncbi:hypothetical protein PV772_08040 [Pseudarthrobacter sp. CC12]|uniref:sunset domain-containing protein n=1 Tax=Pseudarthrobacter sp. CC12 TaxID=3029193 RepID=UPI003265084D
MDIVFWIILIVVIVAVVWWLLRRNKSSTAPGGPAAGARTDAPRADGALEGGSAAASAAAAGTTGIPTAAGFGRAAEPAAPVTAEEPAESSASAAAEAPVSAPTQDVSSSSVAAEDSRVSRTGTSAGTGAHGDRRDGDQPADQAEWETQWSEAGNAGSRSGSSISGAPAAAQHEPSEPGAGTEAVSGQAAAGARPVHHDEYTAAHAPTLPGAETAAVEGVEDAGTAETLDRAQSSALVENGADHHQQPSGPGQDFAQAQGTVAVEPGGHLAADEPYGEGSAAPGPDGSGPADYTVKGDATAMVYYEEGHPDYEQTRAEVWFESAAHAEAAGFRAPRRKRL